jgi:Na+/H+ antiporter NhaD/arsenite permease-like protein
MIPYDLTGSFYGIIGLILFILAYSFVPFEHKLNLRKSKPVMLAAGVIWILLAIAYSRIGDHHTVNEAIRHNILEYAEIFLFLLTSMTYINSLEERNVFQALKTLLVSKGFSLRAVFWITGFLSFVISPIADNLTTALLMGAVVMAIEGDNKKFITLSCINIVVAANAGGTFSPFGDITTLMLWQEEKVRFVQFFYILIPSVISWLIPAIIMSFYVDKTSPKVSGEKPKLKYCAFKMMLLFLLTIVMTVCLHTLLHLPPAVGMMFGLALLGLLTNHIKKHEKRQKSFNPMLGADTGRNKADIMEHISRAEWDTLLFFYGIILCVGGIAQFGYLALISKFLYNGIGNTIANTLIGILSAIVDNIPVMFAVITIDPNMPLGQWLLVTLTIGTGGSLLAIGSAAGVGLLGTTKGNYTFAGHLKWMPVIFLGYILGIITHLLINAKIM